MGNVTAIVMAAGEVTDPELARASGGGPKSLIRAHGRPLISFVMENLRNCDPVSRVILVSDVETRDVAGDVDGLVESEGYDLDCIIQAVRLADESDTCLIVGGDCALASADALADLTTHAPDADVVYPIVSREEMEDAFPERQPFYVAASEGRYTASSCLMFRSEVALANPDVISRLLQARQDPKSLVGLVGLGNAMRFMLTSPSLSEFEETLSGALKIGMRVFVSHYPELFMSVDSIADVDTMERELGY